MFKCNKYKQAITRRSNPTGRSPTVCTSTAQLPFTTSPTTNPPLTTLPSPAGHTTRTTTPSSQAGSSCACTTTWSSRSTPRSPFANVNRESNAYSIFNFCEFFELILGYLAESGWEGEAKEGGQRSPNDRGEEKGARCESSRSHRRMPRSWTCWRQPIKYDSSIVEILSVKANNKPFSFFMVTIKDVRVFWYN